MKRQFFSLFMVMAVFSMYAAQPAAKPTEEEEREWLASSDGQHEDDATRSRKCASFWDVKTGTLTACSAVVRNNLDVEKKLKVRGDATVCGDLHVKGDVIPRTIYLNENDDLNEVINELADCGQNYQPIILSLAPGDYAAGELNVCNSIQDLTIQGDTSPLAGVGFIQGGQYSDPGLQLQCQIRENAAIGRGDLYQVFLATGKLNVVEVTSDEVNPDFSSVAPGTRVCFVGEDGDIEEFVVAGTNANTITFSSNINEVDGLAETASANGVGFVIKPNVTLTGEELNRLTGPKNLKIRGVILNWSDANNLCDGDQGLYLGGVKTKLELSNSIIQGGVRITARESYNCQPNTVLETEGNDIASLVFMATSEPNFIFNSVFGSLASVTAAGSKAGAFSHAQFSAGRLEVVQGARLDAQRSVFYNIDDEDGALFVADGSHVNLANGILYDCMSGPAVNIRNSSGLTTSDPSCPNAPFFASACDIALTVTQNSFAIIRGVTNPEFFADNTIDLDLDGFTFADIDTYPSGVFGSLVSYLITN